MGCDVYIRDLALYPLPYRPPLYFVKARTRKMCG